MDAKQLAIRLIKPYIDRGDSYESLKGFMGMGCTEYDVAIGGYAFDKEGKLLHKGKSTEIVVSKLNGEECCYIFSLEKLYNELKSGQGRLF